MPEQSSQNTVYNSLPLNDRSAALFLPVSHGECFPSHFPTFFLSLCRYNRQRKEGQALKRLQKQDPSPAFSSLRFFLLRFLAGLILSAAQLFGGYAPFALGFTAAMGAGMSGLAALAGIITGAALGMDFSRALRLAAVGVLLFSANTTFHGTRAARAPLFLPVMTALLTAAVETVYLITGEAGLAEAIEGVTVMVLAGLAAYVFPKELPARLPTAPREMFSLLALAAVLLSALTEITLPWELSLGRLLLHSFSMLLAFRLSPNAAAAAGLGVGLLLDLRTGMRTLFFSTAYALANFFLSSRRSSGKCIAAILHALVVAFFLRPAAISLRIPLAEETLLGSLLFLLLPGFGGRRLAAEDPPLSPAERLRSQLNQTALAFRELAESFPRTAAAEESPAILFETAAETVCRRCGLREICWQKEYEATLLACNDASTAMLRRGTAKSEDFPSWFASRCPHLPDLLATLDAELSSFLLRRQYRLRLRQARSSARGQYLQLSDLLSRTAEELSLRAASAVRRAPIAYDVGCSARPRQGESVSGDSFSFFESDSGRTLYLLLSDGMGCGREAQSESATAVRLLERFLRADIPAEAALHTLNAAFSLRSESGGGFTTVDLLAMDLRTGEATLYKYGAAPSYLRQNGEVRRISGSTLPAGLESDVQNPDLTRLHLGRGAVLVLLSDGFFAAQDDRWLREVLEQSSGQNPRALAALLMVDSLQHGGESDDCTALVLSLSGGDTEV